MTWYMLTALITGAVMVYALMGVIITFIMCKVVKTNDPDGVFGWGIVWPITVLLILPGTGLWRLLCALFNREPKMEIPKAKARRAA